MNAPHTSATLGNLTLKQLRAFVTVADSNSFTAAAARLSLSQSAVSLLIRELEGELGLKVLDRTTRSVRLTDAGRELLPVAARVLQDLGAAVAGSRELSARKRGLVRVACSPLQALLIMPRLIAAFVERYPHVNVVMRDTAGGEIVGLVESGEIDLALGVMRRENPFVSAEPLIDDRLLLLYPRTYQWTTRRRIGWNDLVGQPFIALGRQNSTRLLVDDHAAQAGVELTMSFEVAYAWTAIGLVEAGLGVSLIPAYARPLLALHPNVESRMFQEHTIHRPVSLLRRRNRSLSPAAQSFSDFLKEFLATNAAYSGC